MIDAKNNTILRTTPVGIRPGSATLDVNSHRLFVLNLGAALDSDTNSSSVSVTAVDTDNGSILYTVPLGIVSVPNTSPEFGHPFYDPDSRPMIVDSKVKHLFIDEGSSLVMLDEATGTILKRLDGAGGAFGAILAVDEPAGTLYAADSATLQDNTARINTYNIRTGERIYPAPSLATKIEIGEQQPKIIAAGFGAYLIDPRTGAVLRTLITGDLIGIDRQHRRAVATRTLFGDRYGNPRGNALLQIVDASGHTLSSLQIGPFPLGLAVDESGGRVFVATSSPVDAEYSPPITTIFDTGPQPAEIPPPHSPADPIAPPCCARFFPQTRHSLGGAFLSFWHQHGDIAVLGYPLTEPFIQDASPSQYTQRFLLRLVQGTVLPAPLGRILTASRHVPRLAPLASSVTRRYFAQTGHSLSGRFLAYWLAHSGPTLLGAPIAEPGYEGNGDGTGRRYLVQWLENARLEYHPELADSRYVVSLGLLGAQALRQGLRATASAP